MPNTKIKLLQQLLAKVIAEIQKVNKAKGIDFEEKAFYDIVKLLCGKYDFNYPEDKLIELAKAVK